MNTRFELALWGRDETYLTAAGEEALREIEALDQQLSFYRDDSDVRELNALAAHRPVTVEPRLFRLLERARELSLATEGAFDITVGPLLRAWGLTGEGGRVPAPEEIEAAREATGMELLELDPDARTVRFLREGVTIDLGAIGKGYGIERAMELLAEHELPGVLLHGGTSTVAAAGTQPDGSAWTIAVRDPRGPDAIVAQVALANAALSVSAPHGKAFVVKGREVGHVLDPRTGTPAEGPLLAAVRCSSPTDSDALSTGLLVAGEGLFPALEAWEPGCAALLLRRDAASAEVAAWGGFAGGASFVL
jgi:thiamine biosynthesis lipoprotein